jgi:hypothetical protein
VSAVVRALASLLHASYVAVDVDVDAWRTQAADARQEYDRLRAENERLQAPAVSWCEDMDRIAAAVGYPPGSNYGDLLGKIDELRAENERLTRELSECGATLAERWTPADDALMGALVREKELRAEVERLKAACDQYEQRLLIVGKQLRVLSDQLIELSLNGAPTLGPRQSESTNTKEPG